MGQIAVTLNSRTYRLTCDDGEESRLSKLAEFFRDQVEAVCDEVGQVGDDRIYVMAALKIIDRHFDLEEKLEELKRQSNGTDPDF